MESTENLVYFTVEKIEEYVKALGLACARSDDRPHESWSTVGRVLGQLKVTLDACRLEPTCSSRS